MRHALRLLVSTVLIVGILLSLASRRAQGAELSPADAATDRIKVWIYFRDHGEANPSELRAALDRAEIGARARERRLRRMKRGVADVHDLPLHRSYVEPLRALGCDIRRESRYLNAVSAWVRPDALPAIAALPFVQRTEPVRFGRRPDSVDPWERWPGDGLLREGEADRAAAEVSASSIDYGYTGSQQRQINVVPLHDAGFHGEGVRIAVLDTGFFRGHSAFANLNVIAEWDFINGDSVTADQINWPSYDRWGQMSHGTSTLGILAANLPGRIVGTAWAAEYILAKTERVFDEVRIEEDDYVAAIEWADQLGADVVSSSLGYYNWYRYEDMDGKTAVSTKAVDIAASHGVVVVTAAGNEGGFPWPTLLAPSDAAGAIAVGATDTLGVIASFSSRGPTYDGRIKPDVVTRGVWLVTAYWDNPNLITLLSGTSASTPLVAGACALILQKHPDWTPTQVADALRATASQASTPDNDYGWGRVDAFAASEHGRRVAVTLDLRGGSCESPFNPKRQGVLPVLVLGSEEVSVADIDVGSLRLGGAGAARSRILDLGGPGGEGRCIRPSPDGRDDLLLSFSSADLAGAIGSAGRGDVASLELTGAMRDGTALEGVALVRIVGDPGRTAARAPAPAAVLAAEARPNPFNPSTRISYRVPETTRVRLSVYDIAGRRVATLVDAQQPAGSHAATWNAAGRPSGVYFYRLDVGGRVERKRLILLK